MNSLIGKQYFAAMGIEHQGILSWCISWQYVGQILPVGLPSVFCLCNRWFINHTEVKTLLSVHLHWRHASCCFSAVFCFFIALARVSYNKSSWGPAVCRMGSAVARIVVQCGTATFFQSGAKPVLWMDWNWMCYSFVVSFFLTIYHCW